MDYYNVNFTPQGWQCPICKRVYSPTTPMCYYCGGKEVTTSSTTVGTMTKEEFEKEYKRILRSEQS